VLIRAAAHADLARGRRNRRWRSALFSARLRPSFGLPTIAGLPFRDGSRPLERNTMTDDERTLLLTIGKWCLKLETSAAADMGRADHPSLTKLRELIARVEQPEPPTMTPEQRAQ
jgi:hypothetical protein